MFNKDKLSKSEFFKYHLCRKWDVFKNYDLREVSKICEIDKDKVIFICINYNLLKEGFGFN